MKNEFLKKTVVAVATGVLVLGGITPTFAAKPEITTTTVTVTDANGNQISSIITPEDSWDYNRTMDKTVSSMYGSVYMKVTYNRNLSRNTSTITGIATLSNTDPYLKLVDSWYTASTAQADYYDSFHKVYVTIKITSAECK